MLVKGKEKEAKRKKKAVVKSKRHKEL